MVIFGILQTPKLTFRDFWEPYGDHMGTIWGPYGDHVFPFVVEHVASSAFEVWPWVLRSTTAG